MKHGVLLCFCLFWKGNYLEDVLNLAMFDIKRVLLHKLLELRDPRSNKHICYYLCKHVVLPSNEPFTESIMKQLALAQAKWEAESSRVYAAGWKQMFHKPNITNQVLQRSRRDFESASFSSAHWIHLKMCIQPKTSENNT